MKSILTIIIIFMLIITPVVAVVTSVNTDYNYRNLFGIFNLSKISGSVANFTYYYGNGAGLTNIVYTETDPVFTAWDKDYNDLINRPDLSLYYLASNPSNYISNAQETDQVFVANRTSIWDAIGLRLLITDQRYNDTVLINAVNNSLQSQIALQAANNVTQAAQISSLSNRESANNLSQANLISSINSSLMALIDQSNCVGENTFSIGFDGIYNYCNTVNTSALNIPFSSLSNYPAPCSPGYAITGLGDSVTCTIDDDSPDSDSEVPNAITVSGGTLGSNTIAAGTSWTTAGNFGIIGNVGIGTTAPGNKLDVAGGLTVTGAISTGKGLGLSDEGTYKRIQSWETEPLAINPLGNNVGIGTTVPVNKLDVAGGLTVTGAIYTGKGLGLSDEGTYKRIQSWETEPLAINPLGNNVGIGTTSPSNRLTVSGNADITGNLGIGTASPSKKLTVSGDAYVSGNVTVIDRVCLNSACTSYMYNNGTGVIII